MRSHDVVAMNAWALTQLPALLVGAMTAIATPLALHVANVPRWLRLAAWPAGLLAAIPFAPLVVPYAIVAICAGVVGLARLAARHGPASRIAIASGLVMLPAATTWLVAARFEYKLLGYEPFWVILTAAHFHVAGVYLMTIAGRVAHGRGRIAGAIALACVICVPLTAAGIYGPMWLEVSAAVAMAVTGFATGILLVTNRGIALRIAGVVLLVTMPLAGAFALRSIDPGSAVTILGLDPLGSMLVVHGAPNALAFALIALVALARAPVPSILCDAPPMSRIAGSWPVGADFLARNNYERAIAPQPRGLVDDLGDLLDPRNVAPSIRAFYEQTADHAMIVRPFWRFGFRTGAKLWAAIARKIGQLQLPLVEQSENLASRVVAVEPLVDGRAAPRSWIRTFDDGRALYVAIYSTHRRDGHAYMNIAFPLPRGNLTSILRMTPLAGSTGGVSVTTRAGGDSGVWVRLFGIPIRTPMSETIDVWTIDDPAAPPELRAWATGFTTIARHTLWIFGVRYLTLHYAMRV